MCMPNLFLFYYIRKTQGRRTINCQLFSVRHSLTARAKNFSKFFALGTNLEQSISIAGVAKTGEG